MFKIVVDACKIEAPDIYSLLLNVASPNVTCVDAYFTELQFIIPLTFKFDMNVELLLNDDTPLTFNELMQVNALLTFLITI